MSEERLSCREFAERFPVGNDPEKTWCRLLQKWREESLLKPGQHWFYAPSKANQQMRVYRVGVILRLCAKEARSPHVAPFFFNLFAHHNAAILACLKPCSTASEQPSGTTVPEG